MLVDECLEQVVKRIPGLRAVLVSDRDGIAILRYPPEESGVATPSGMEAAFAIAADQASKTYMGKCQAITAIYDNLILVQVNDPPLVISLVADIDSNVGSLVALAPKLRDALAPLREALARVAH
mmetsp:Transcript_25078/g.63302  ORF Transcript_25078/g.63302 Transcript_25078/m.63302 type:complete len:124 (-) Transcript_25078:140-511(-)